MKDTLHKFAVYFTSTPAYWKLAPQEEVRNQQIGYYPLSFRDRLYQEHYVHFDAEGLPQFHSKVGNLVYFCTGLCSFAFAHWEEYLLTGKTEHASNVVEVADKLRSMAVEQVDSLMIYDYDDEELTNPLPCAMNQGEAISVMVRAYSYTGLPQYKEWAEKLALPFDKEYGMDGVTRVLPKNQTLWFLEGGRFILNGHIYALFGLMELHKISATDWLSGLIENGTEAVQKSLSIFDTGYWSWYQLTPTKYIASAMYHNLHVCQLQALAASTGKEEFTDYAQRFANYAGNAVYRLWAGFMLVLGKVQMKLAK